MEVLITACHLCCYHSGQKTVWHDLDRIPRRLLDLFDDGWLRLSRWPMLIAVTCIDRFSFLHGSPICHFPRIRVGGTRRNLKHGVGDVGLTGDRAARQTSDGSVNPGSVEGLCHSIREATETEAFRAP